MGHRRGGGWPAATWCKQVADDPFVLPSFLVRVSLVRCDEHVPVSFVSSTFFTQRNRQSKSRGSVLQNLVSSRHVPIG